MDKKTCSKCKEEKLLSEFYFSKRKGKCVGHCQKCRSEYFRTKYKLTKSWIFYHRAWNIKKQKGQGKGIPIMPNLKEHLVNLWEHQKGICFYTGRKMELAGFRTNPNAMTVDRMNPNMGYVEGNLVLCCWIANRTKSKYTYEEVIAFCKDILRTAGYSV